MNVRIALLPLLLVLLSVSTGSSALTLWCDATGVGGTAPDPLPAITRRISVNVVQTFLDDGTSGATVFGTATQQAAIFGFVDDIYRQVGVDVSFVTGTTWNDSFAHEGDSAPYDPNTMPPTVRPGNDFDTVMGDPSRPTASDPNVINLYMVDEVPQFSTSSANNVKGLAFIGVNGIMASVGSNLPGFLGGQEVVASVIAHEIGHNLGLGHLTPATGPGNLMQVSGAPSQGECFSQAQIDYMFDGGFAGNNFLVAVPEPSPMLFGTVVFAIVGMANYRRKILPAD